MTDPAPDSPASPYAEILYSVADRVASITLNVPDKLIERAIFVYHVPGQLRHRPDQRSWIRSVGVGTIVLRQRTRLEALGAGIKALITPPAPAPARCPVRKACAVRA